MPSSLLQTIPFQSGDSPGTRTSVRWLANLCAVAGPAAPLPQLASELLQEPECAATTKDYIAWWMRHPDKGSTFESRVQALRDAPDEAAMSVLARRGYDGLIFPHEGVIAGHVFFQNHGTQLAAFSASVSKDFRGGRLWAVFSLDFVAYAASLPGIHRASVGTGKNLVGRLLLRLIRPHSAELGWQVNDDGWIDFHHGAQS